LNTCIVGCLNLDLPDFLDFTIMAIRQSFNHGSEIFVLNHDSLDLPDFLDF